MNTETNKSSHDGIIAALKKFILPIARTMGPGGQNVGILINHKGKFVGSNATQDGVTLAKHMYLSDSPEERYVSHLLSESSERQLASVGDGTSSTLVLCLAMFQMFVNISKRKSIRFAKVMYTRMENEIRELWKNQVYDAWLDPGRNDESATDEQKEQYQLHKSTIEGVAGVATHGDESLTKLLVTAALHVGPSGQIDVQRPEQGGDRHRSEDTVELGQGMVLKCRLPFRQFANSRMRDRQFFLADKGCAWIISNTPVSSGAEVAKSIQAYNHVFKDLGENKPPLIMLAPRFDEEAVNMASNNSIQKYGYNPQGGANGVMICLLQTEGFYGDKEGVDVIEDVSRVVKAPIFGTKTDKKLTHAYRLAQGKHAVFGLSTGEVKISYDGTSIRFVGEEEGHVTELGNSMISRGEAEFEEGSSDLAKNYISRGKRILGQTAKIILRSGPFSVQSSRFDLADDAVRTLTSACRSGVVRGQGVGLYNLCYDLIFVMEDKYGYDTDLLLDVMPDAFQSVRDQVLENMQVPHDDPANEIVLENITREDTSLADIVAFNDDGDGYQAINANEHFIYDGADTAITALEISFQTSRQLGTTEYLMDVYQ